MSGTSPRLAFVSARKKLQTSRILLFACIAATPSTCNAWRRKQGPSIAVCAIYKTSFPTNKSKRCSLWACWKKTRKNMSLVSISLMMTLLWSIGYKYDAWDSRSIRNSSFSFRIMPISLSITLPLKSILLFQGSRVSSIGKINLCLQRSSISSPRRTRSPFTSNTLLKITKILD